MICRVSFNSSRDFLKTAIEILQKHPTDGIGNIRIRWKYANETDGY